MPRRIVLSALGMMFLISIFGDRYCASQENWPGWLGPKRNGWVDGIKAPSTWPDKLNKVWQIEVGTGYGSPLVVDGLVYLHTRQDEEEVLRCVDLTSGTVQWRQSYAAPFKVGGGSQFHGKGPKACPVIADGRVFAMSITGVLSAWDATSGKLLWRRDYDDSFEKSHPYWGAATSPIIDGNQIIVHFGTDEVGALIALDVATGKEIWSHGKDGPSYSSPILVEIQGVQQIVQWNQRALVGVESKTGRHLWEYPIPQAGTNQNMPTPVTHQDRILLGGENRGVSSLEPQLNDQTWTVKERWHQEDVALDMSSAVINRDLLYGFSHYDKGRFFCLDTKSGEVLWKGPSRTGDNVMFLSMPGHIIALIDNGELRIIAATGKSYRQVASYQVSESPTWAPPVLLEDGILVKDKQTLTLWSLSDRSSADKSPSQ